MLVFLLAPGTGVSKSEIVNMKTPLSTRKGWLHCIDYKDQQQDGWKASFHIDAELLMSTKGVPAFPGAPLDWFSARVHPTWAHHPSRGPGHLVGDQQMGSPGLTRMQPGLGEDPSS